MVEYSYVISIDEQQLQSLDDKIKKLEGLTGEEQSIDSLADKLSEILEATGLRSEDKTTETLEEINNNVLAIKASVESIMWEIEGLDVDEHKLAEIMMYMAKDIFAGDIMGTRRIYDAIERIENLAKGDLVVSSVGEPGYDVGKMAADMETMSMVGHRSMNEVTEGIMKDMREKTKFENFFGEIDTESKYLNMLLQNAPVAEKKYTKEMKDIQQEMNAYSAAFQANVDESARLKVEKGPSGLWQPNFDDPEHPFYLYKYGNPDDIRDLGPRHLGKRLLEIDDLMVLQTENMATQRQKKTKAGEEYLLSTTGTGLTTGGNVALRYEMIQIAQQMSQRLEGQLGDTLSDVAKEKFMTSVGMGLESMFNLSKKGGYTSEEVLKIKDMAETMGWKSDKDMIRGLGSFLSGQEQDPMKLALYEDLLGSLAKMVRGGLIAQYSEDISSADTIRGGLAAAEKKLGIEPTALLTEQVKIAVDDAVKGTASTAEEKTVADITKITSVGDLNQLIKDRGLGEVVTPSGKDLQSLVSTLQTMIDEMRRGDPYADIKVIESKSQQIIEMLGELGVRIEGGVSLHHSAGSGPK